jgi:hypothetical protein
LPAAQISAVQLDQIKGEEMRLGLNPPAAAQ